MKALTRVLLGLLGLLGRDDRVAPRRIEPPRLAPTADIPLSQNGKKSYSFFEYDWPDWRQSPRIEVLDGGFKGCNALSDDYSKKKYDIRARIAGCSMEEADQLALEYAELRGLRQQTRAALDRLTPEVLGLPIPTAVRAVLVRLLALYPDPIDEDGDVVTGTMARNDAPHGAGHDGDTPGPQPD